jgi:NUMOD4 motif/HNH endonuclease
MKEIWRDLIGYEDFYSVSNKGNVLSKRQNINLKPGNNGRGYLFVGLWKDSNRTRFYVHRLVALCFIENPFNKEHVNHKDCDKGNNNVYNLEWCTLKENMIHASKNNRLYASDYQKRQTSLANSGSKSALSKLTENDVIKIKTILQNKTHTQNQIALMFNITRSNVSCIKRNISWKSVQI